MKRKKFRIGITSGDPFGIGPEVTIKSLERFRDISFVLYGSKVQFEKIAEKANVSLNDIEFKDVYTVRSAPLENPSQEGAKMAFKALETALKDIKKLDALVTGPVSKKGMFLAGIPFTGHTEYLAKKLRVSLSDVVMTFFSKPIIVALYSTHIPLKDISLDKEKLSKKINTLRRILGENISLGILGLNPHSGEGGFIGKEEKIIENVIKRHNRVYGPFPADSYFSRSIYKDFDITLALYHDQGLIPFKLISKGKGAQATLGLPFIRTSPDHGPAYDLRELSADPSSMTYAIKLGIELRSLNR